MWQCVAVEPGNSGHLPVMPLLVLGSVIVIVICVDVAFALSRLSLSCSRLGLIQQDALIQDDSGLSLQRDYMSAITSSLTLHIRLLVILPGPLCGAQDDGQPYEQHEPGGLARG